MAWVTNLPPHGNFVIHAARNDRGRLTLSLGDSNHAGGKRAPALRAPTSLQLAGQVREAVGVRAAAAGLAAVQRVDLRHLVGVQLEVEEPDVLLDARGRRRLREDDAAALD